jgi:hypothetical protein
MRMSESICKRPELARPVLRRMMNYYVEGSIGTHGAAGDEENPLPVVHTLATTAARESELEYLSALFHSPRSLVRYVGWRSRMPATTLHPSSRPAPVHA